MVKDWKNGKHAKQWIKTLELYAYRKLLCIAFDFALLRAHLDDAFPPFAFHDGVFESLDD